MPRESQKGNYLAVVEARYEKSFAVSSDLFSVISKKAEAKEPSKSNIALMYALIFAVGLLFLIGYLAIKRFRIFKKV